MVDSTPSSSFLAGSRFEDFFNVDMFTGPSATGSSSSRSSSNSPSTSFAELPLTPPNAFESSAADAAGDFLNFILEDDLSKVDTYALSSATPFDFMSAFPTTEESSPDSGSSPSSGDSPVTIDPQVVNTPSVSAAMSEFDEEEGLPDDEDLDGEDKDDEMVTIEPVKVGGKGKNRKGTVQSGGIVKKGAKEKKEAKSPAMLSTTSMEPDDWRPTPEEYKKMSSKEKRQLRNKISARNFRVRRKEYINTLEGDIAERDRLIDAIRTELGSTKSENSALRQEIEALKKALLDGRGRPDTPILPPPGPLPAVPAAVTALRSPPPTPKSPALVVPNVHKDVSMSPRLGGHGFWGGNLSGFGGVTPVHTTLIPDLSTVLSGKPLSRRSPTLQENLNPALNSPPAPQDKSKELTLPMQMTPFDTFTDTNPFTMKTLDAYRMQLWGRMAEQQAAHNRQQQPPQTPQQQQQHLTGLASGMRPHFFAKSPTLSAILANKPASSAYPTPAPSPAPLRPSSAHNQTAHTSHPTDQQAMLASIASQTLLGKLGSAFWDAFSGSSASPAAGRSREWDADKVRRVLEGKAVVRVVDIEPATASASTPAPSPVIEKASPAPPPRPAKFAEKCNNCLVDMFGSLHV
ncbi:hypothetical protein EIP86_008573 [Pleurotus ostreatoroseus]|nr:hypothetical protein EIP86_008573 [Pleurotus ostreatoroseus]